VSEPAPRLRDGERTRGKILEAARKEFARKGFDGARVEAIARKAHVNKGLIFYYFQSKEGLFRTLAETRLEPPPRPLVDGLDASNPFQWPLGLFALGDETLDWVRFFLWEGLDVEDAAPALLMQERRQAGWRRRVAWVRRQQQAGRLPAELNAEQLTLFLYVLGVYPLMVPQLAYLITGALPTEPRFRAEFDAFVRGLERLVVPRRGARDPDSQACN
jgi:AcrR family transcriptional regulator